MMNIGHGDSRYGEDMSSNNSAYGVPVNPNTSALSPYLSIDPSYLQQGGAEFVFPTDHKKTRTWGERMFSGIGSSYLTGLVAGGSWGLYEGLRNPDGRTFKLRMNSVLNGCTRRGPFVANSLGVLALMYSTLDYGIGKLRDKEDEYNSIAAAISTGLIFKSTAGIRAMGIAAAVGGSLATVYNLSEKFTYGKGSNVISSPGWA
ncbi:mitochondrial import inner membrane translocase subunit tim23-like [Xenia sp. Carnegie-2017]|uniref:mitochondrial import inner membrane translocase subunit tim23-like n=1 Tax=Xenia sp. Carnegie-2017 TaxID=2897299 RepID=UPI001F0376B3|nr:mitochondrial import inner membrane translocase subunit tim23-like [Xenia sp. Carnegie-2017]